MTRINKPLARKMYYSGCTIIIVPCKCRFDNEVARAELNMICNCEEDPLTFTFTLGSQFDTRVREFEYHNCNNELGYYAHYYVSDKDMANYSMCKLMC